MSDLRRQFIALVAGLREIGEVHEWCEGISYNGSWYSVHLEVSDEDEAIRCAIKIVALGHNHTVLSRRITSEDVRPTIPSWNPLVMVFVDVFRKCIQSPAFMAYHFCDESLVNFFLEKLEPLHRADFLDVMAQLKYAELKSQAYLVRRPRKYDLNFYRKEINAIGWKKLVSPHEITEVFERIKDNWEAAQIL